MMNNRYLSLSMLLILMIGIVAASESYLDYGDETADRNLEDLREFYKRLARRYPPENVPIFSAPYEHLMIRKSQRSPSLRLRFGRSGLPMSNGILARLVNSQSTVGDN